MAETLSFFVHRNVPAEVEIRACWMAALIAYPVRRGRGTTWRTG
jgi:hypothetical protein